MAANPLGLKESKPLVGQMCLHIGTDPVLRFATSSLRVQECMHKEEFVVVGQLVLYMVSTSLLGVLQSCGKDGGRRQ